MHIQSTHHVLIAGSRYATREMLDYARRAVQRAHAKGYTIIVGDNPKGVDCSGPTKLDTIMPVWREWRDATGLRTRQV